MGSKSADTSPEPSDRSKLAQWACLGGAAVVGASRFVAEKTQIPEWMWMLMLGVGAAACASGAIFWAFDEVKKLSASATKAETLKRGVHLVILAAVLAAVALFLIFRFPSASRLFKPSETKPSQTEPGPKPAPEASPDPRKPSIAPETKPAAVDSPAPTPTPTPAPTTPDPGVRESEIVLLYENETRTLCGQPKLGVRQSARSGWVLYSKDFLATFQERPLVVGQAIKIGSCDLVLTHIEPNPLRFDFEMRWGR